jgi:hypothetical protein
VASPTPTNIQTEAEVTGEADALHPDRYFDVFQNAPDLPGRSDPATTQDQQPSGDEGWDPEDTNGESQTTDSSYFSEVVHEDEDDAYNADEDDETEGLSRYFSEFDLKMEEFQHRNPDIPLDQLEIQVGYLQDVLDRLPNDLLDDPHKLRQELLIRGGVAEFIINQHMEYMAAFKAARHSPAETAAHLTSPSGEQVMDNTPWTATLPVRSPQQEQDLEAGQSQISSVNEQPAPGQESVLG